MIRIAPLRPSDHARWTEPWSEYFYAVELPATVSAAAYFAFANRGAKCSATEFMQ
jgi:hypothetical protein